MKQPKPSRQTKGVLRVGSGDLLGVMVMAWVLAMVAWLLAVCFWMQERRQWDENAAKYQHQLRELQDRLQSVPKKQSASDLGGNHPTASEIADLPRAYHPPQTKGQPYESRHRLAPQTRRRDFGESTTRFESFQDVIFQPYARMTPNEKS